MMESIDGACSICGRKDVRLLSAIIDNEVKKICEFCASVNNEIVMVEKPTEAQLKEAERQFTVYERLKRMSKMQIHEDELQLRELKRREEAGVNLSKLAAKKNDEQFMQKHEERKQINLAQDFNEQIGNARNLKGLSQKQLGDSIAEPEETVRMLERGIMPQDSEKIIRKVEQYLRVDLRKKQQDNSERKVDFKSSGITVADLKKMREEMFGKKED